MRHDTSVSLKVTGRLLLSCGRQTEKACRPNSVLFWWKTVDLAGDDCTWHLLYDTVVVVIVWLVRWPMLLFLWEHSVHVSSVPNDRRCKVGVDCLEPVVTWLARWPVQSLGSWTRLSSTNLYCAKGCKQIGGTVLQCSHYNYRWLGSRVVSVLDSGAEGSRFKLQLRCCRVTVLGRLFTPIMPLFIKQRNW